MCIYILLPIRSENKQIEKGRLSVKIIFNLKIVALWRVLWVVYILIYFDECTLKDCSSSTVLFEGSTSSTALEGEVYVFIFKWFALFKRLYKYLLQIYQWNQYKTNKTQKNKLFTQALTDISNICAINFLSKFFLLSFANYEKWLHEIFQNKFTSIFFHAGLLNLKPKYNDLSHFAIKFLDFGARCNKSIFPIFSSILNPLPGVDRKTKTKVRFLSPSQICRANVHLCWAISLIGADLTGFLKWRGWCLMHFATKLLNSTTQVFLEVI